MSIQTKKSSTRKVIDYYFQVNFADLKFLSPKTSSGNCVQKHRVETVFKNIEWKLCPKTWSGNCVYDSYRSLLSASKVFNMSHFIQDNF